MMLPCACQGKCELYLRESQTSPGFPKECISPNSLCVSLFDASEAYRLMV